jgi:threonyl-tRNA synthetase
MAPPSTRRPTSTRTSERLEEAKRRDHRRLGTELDLFHLSDHAPGMPYWHPKGMVLWNVLGTCAAART